MYVRNRYLIAHGTYVITLIPRAPVHVDASFAELKTIRAGIVVRGRRPVKTRDVHFLDAVVVVHADCGEENVVAVDLATDHITIPACLMPPSPSAFLA